MTQVNYTLEYRPVEELISEVQLYFSKYAASDVIQPGDIINVAWQTTYDLGLRIFNVDEKILELYNFHARLPDNFYSLNYAFLCSMRREITDYPMGLQTEMIPLDDVQYRDYSDVSPCQTSNPCDINIPPRKICTFCNGKNYELVQKVGNIVYSYSGFVPVKLVHYSGITKLCNGCPNINVESAYTISIKNRFVNANVSEGHLYINYMGFPMDENGNMLIPNHPYLNRYYKYACIKDIAERLMLNMVIDPNVYQVIYNEYRMARNNAVSFVNTPNFSELKKMWEYNRKMMYNKYYSFFAR